MDFRLLRKNEVGGGFRLMFQGEVAGEDIEVLDLVVGDHKRIECLMRAGRGLEASADRLAALSLLFLRAAQCVQEGSELEARFEAEQLIERVRGGLR